MSTNRTGALLLITVLLQISSFGEITQSPRALSDDSQAKSVSVPAHAASPQPQSESQKRKWPSATDIFWPTWGLVIVGGLGFWAAMRTLGVIRQQTNHIEQQVREMQATSKQTDTLIQQATKHADSAKNAAEAAFRNAQAVIDAQRAWILVDVERVPGMGGVFLGTTIERGIETEHTMLNVRVMCRNEGKTPAWITEKRAGLRIVKSIPLEPDLEGLEIIQPEPEALAAGRDTTKDVSLTFNQQRADDEVSLVYGMVKYRDIFQVERQTVFAYRLNLSDRLERLAGYSEYNKST